MQAGEVIRTDGGEDQGPVIVPNRWMLIRDVAVFQLKLAVDGFRDLVMMPVSMGLAILDLLQIGPRAGRQFYDLLKIGRKTDHWINLFGASDHAEPLPVVASPGIDSLVHKMERLVIQEYEKGGITSSAKASVDRLLDGMADRSSSK